MMHVKFSIIFLICLIVSVVVVSCDHPRQISKNWIHLTTPMKVLPEPGPSTQQTACLILDIDKDGINDFVVGCREKASSVLWYRRVSSRWVKYIIDNTYLRIEAGGAFYDIDGDDDLDIVFGGDWKSNKVWWWENPYPVFDPSVPWKRREIKASGLTMHHDELFGDFDNDGRVELVFWNQGTHEQLSNKLFITDIPRNPKRAAREWLRKAIFTSSFRCEGLCKADIDCDGLIDIVGGGRWFKFYGKSQYKPMVIDDGQRESRAAVGQLVEGGRPEVVFVPGDGIGRLRWYEWKEKKWVAHDLLEHDVDHGHSLQLADFNSDGHLDIFCGEMRLNGRHKDAKMWIFFGDGRGNFQKLVIAKGYGVHEAKVGDLDGDADIDILGKPYNWDTPRLDIWLNNMVKENYLSLDCWQRHVIDQNKPWRSIFITAGDIDKDGKLDVVTGGWWYKNPGNLQNPWFRRSIGTPLFNMAAVYDFDSDGDLDVLGTEGKGSSVNCHFVWAENIGSGKFLIHNNVSSGVGDFLQGVAIFQLVPERKYQIALSWHRAGEGIQVLTIPEQPRFQMWTLDKISNVSQDECLSAGDIDRDGDTDLLLGTKWLQNCGGSWKALDLTSDTGLPDRNRLIDINGDGKLDAIVGFEAISKKGKIVWYQQGEDPASEWQEHFIAEVIGPMSLDVADMDRDGDVDIVVGEHNLRSPSKAKLYVFENSNGQGLHWKKHVIYEGDEHHDGARIFDIDGDGDLDIISIGWGHNKVVLYENEATGGK